MTRVDDGDAGAEVDEALAVLTVPISEFTRAWERSASHFRWEAAGNANRPWSSADVVMEVLLWIPGILDQNRAGAGGGRNQTTRYRYGEMPPRQMVIRCFEIWSRPSSALPRPRPELLDDAAKGTT